LANLDSTTETQINDVTGQIDRNGRGSKSGKIGSAADKVDNVLYFVPGMDKVSKILQGVSIGSELVGSYQKYITDHAQEALDEAAKKKEERKKEEKKKPKCGSQPNDHAGGATSGETQACE
jgi:hypothetical protein